MTQVTSKLETVGDLRKFVAQLDKLDVEDGFKLAPKRGNILAVELDQDDPAREPTALPVK